MKVITVHDTPPYGHAPTYQISLTYLERQKGYGRKYLIRHNYNIQIKEKYLYYIIVYTTIKDYLAVA
jgi:hypothetical protein